MHDIVKAQFLFSIKDLPLCIERSLKIPQYSHFFCIRLMAYYLDIWGELVVLDVLHLFCHLVNISHWLFCSCFWFLTFQVVQSKPLSSKAVGPSLDTHASYACLLLTCLQRKRFIYVFVCLLYIYLINLHMNRSKYFLTTLYTVKYPVLI